MENKLLLTVVLVCYLLDAALLRADAQLVIIENAQCMIKRANLLI